MIDSEVFDFMLRCGERKAAQPLLADLLQCVGNFGFQHLILSGVPVGGQKLLPMVELNGWPAGWFERYVEAEHAAVDGVCLFSARTARPFHWSDVPGHLAQTRGSRQVEGEASEFGIRSGFAVPMLSLIHNWQSVVSFASPEVSLKLDQRHRAQVVSMAICAGMAIEQLAMDRTVQVRLTARESETLSWSAAGKTSWEIGEIMSISERTVRKHLISVKQKFGVATTVQAVVEATRSRLIHP